MDFGIAFFIVSIISSMACIWFLKTKEKEGKGKPVEKYNSFISIASNLTDIMFCFIFIAFILSSFFIVHFTPFIISILISWMAFGTIFTYFIRNKLMDLVDNAYYINEEFYDFFFYYLVFLNIVNPVGFILYKTFSKILNLILFKNVFYATIKQRKEKYRN